MNNERLYEVALFGTAIPPQSVTGTTYNGIALGATPPANGVTNATGIDCQGQDGIQIVLEAGTFSGTASASCQLMSSSINDCSTAVAVPGAQFIPVTSSNYNSAGASQLGYYFSSIGNRYIWVQTVVTGATGAGLLAASYALGRGVVMPQQVVADATNPSGQAETVPVMGFVVDDAV